MTTQLSKSDFQQMIINTKALSIVQFKTEWNGACQIMAPMYQELSKTYKGQAHFFSVDAERDKELYHAYGIMELPAFLFFKDGQLIDHSVGLTSRNILIAKIENALTKNNQL